MTNGQPGFEIPAEMRDFAERSVEQAKKAMDGFMSAAQRAADSLEGSADSVTSSSKEMRAKTFALAEKNLQATFEHAQKLVRAKDPTEAMRLQAEFVQSQFAAMQAAMRDFGAEIRAATNKATKTK